MADEKFLMYKDKPMVRCGNEIYYGDMSQSHIIKLNILSTKKEGENELPDKVEVQLLKSDIQLPEKERIVKKGERESLYDSLDLGFVWLERALKDK